MAYGTVNADVIQSSVSGVSLGAGNATVFKNRLINGAMVIDQRNSGASVTASIANNETYTLDRWSYYATQASKFTVQQNAGSVTPPAGFSYYLGVTSSSAYSVTSTDWFTVKQSIEGFNGADLGWGTADAKTITLSFWVRSSLTGTFGGSLRNSAGNYSYPFSYSIPVANTWTQVSITIAGPTAGTWAGATNGTFTQLFFGLGVGSSYSGTAGAWAASTYGSATGATSVVGTNGATWYITGVQLEVGSSATGFEYRDYGRELYMCERYTRVYGDGLQGVARTVNDPFFNLAFEQPMRATPTASLFYTNGIKISDDYTTDYTSTGSAMSQTNMSNCGGRIAISGFTGLTAGRHYGAFGNTDGRFLLLSSEL